MEINVLILGKSGAGKSSVLNYLWGIEKAKTGIGKPVTEKGRTGIHRHDPVVLNGHDLIISDSWGLEADKADEWLETVMPALEKHESSPNVEDWFHTVIYCIGASGARIEPFETREVVSRLQKAGHTVIFALTKADRASKEELAALRKTIGEDTSANGGIVEIETRNEERRDGTLMQPRGKAELIEVIMANLTVKLQRKLAIRYLKKCRDLCADWQAETLQHYDKEVGFFTGSSTMQKAKDAAESQLISKLETFAQWQKKEAAKLADFQRAFGEAMDSPMHGADFTFRGITVRSVTVESATGWGDSISVGIGDFHFDIPPVASKILDSLVSLTEDKHRANLEASLRLTVDEIIERAESHIPAEWRTEDPFAGKAPIGFIMPPAL